MRRCLPARPHRWSPPGRRLRKVPAGSARQAPRAARPRGAEHPGDARDLTVAAYLTEWLAHIRRHVRPSTYVGYETNIRLHLIPRIGKKKLARLAVRDVRLLVDGMRADGHRARVVQHSHATLRVALEHAYREEIVPRNVAKPVRVERPAPVRPREPMTADEAVHLLKDVEGDRLAALWTLLSCSGSGAARRAACGGSTSTSKPGRCGSSRPSSAPTDVAGAADQDPALQPHRAPAARCRYALAEHHPRVQDANAPEPGEPWHPSGYVFGTAWGTPMDPRNLTRSWERSASGCRSARCRSMRCGTRASACCLPWACTREL